MTITEHKTSFAGYPLTEWNDGPLSLSIKAYRLSVDFDDGEPWGEKFSRLVHSPHAEQIEVLVVGAWWNEDFRAQTATLVEALVLYHETLPHLRGLFLADVTFEESEISWINQTDLSPIFLAYPRLEHFGARGTDGLQFGHLQHEALQSFALESGGTPTPIIQQLVGAQLPALVDFELWTGSSGYGWNGTLDNLMPFIRGETFPNLTRLGICNCEIADEVAQALVASPLYDQLQHVDLSRGTLGDDGAKALLSHPATKRLKSLNVRHHFCSPPIEAQLYGLMGDGVKVMIDTAQDARDWDEDGRYVAVGE